MDKYEELQQIKSLLDTGALTQEEFEQQKQTIINNAERSGIMPQKNKFKIVGIVILILGILGVIGTVVVFTTSLREATEWVEQYGLAGVNGLVLGQSPISYALEQTLILPPLYLTVCSLVAGIILMIRSKTKK